MRLSHILLLLSFLIVSLFAKEEKREEERFLPENPSSIITPEGTVNNLTSQVGRAIITERELAVQKAEEERVAKLEEKERAKLEAIQARLDARKAKSIALPSTCKGYDGTKSYEISRGVTLGKIGANVYGNSAYSTWVSCVNDKPANKLFIGEKLLTPTPSEAFSQLEGKAVYEKYPYAIRDCLSIHERFKKLEPIILKERKTKKGYSDETKKELDEMIWEMEQIKKDFYEKVEGVNEFPISTTTQLHSAYTNLKNVRRGDLGTKNLRLQRVHLYLINGFSYAYAWGRDGFITPKQ